MDRANLAELERLRPADATAHVGTVHGIRAGARARRSARIPYYGGIEDFERVLDLCEVGARAACCAKLAARK